MLPSGIHVRLCRILECIENVQEAARTLKIVQYCSMRHCTSHSDASDDVTAARRTTLLIAYSDMVLARMIRG